MSRTPTARSVALRNDLLVGLRAAEKPQSTPQILTRVANHGRNCASARPACPDVDQCRALCWHQRIYPQLRALERAGLIARVRYPNPHSINEAIARGQLRQHLAAADSRYAYWQYVDADNDDALNALLDALEDQ